MKAFNVLSDPTVGQLLSLVRASLWNEAADSRPFADNNADWDTIGRLAMLQTVGPLAVKGATTLPAHLLPPKEWQLKGYALTERNRRTHRLLDSCVAETFTRLEDAGFSPVLLKGQAYARAYPDPALRQCGDIDIYVGPDAYRAAAEAAERLGWGNGGKFSPYAKHYNCSIRGVEVELHRVAARLSSLTADRRFHQWSECELASGVHLEIGGKEVAVPSPLFDVVFVFLHMFHHFFYGGVGLRQVCDWTMLLHTHAATIDSDELGSLLKSFGLLRAWRLFTSIAVDFLGLPEEECPLYSPEYGHKAGMILPFIIREGNFGRGLPKKKERQRPYLLRKVHSFLSYPTRLYTKFRIDPVTVMRYHFGFMVRGVQQVLADLKTNFE